MYLDWMLFYVVYVICLVNCLCFIKINVFENFNFLNLIILFRFCCWLEDVVGYYKGVL